MPRQLYSSDELLVPGRKSFDVRADGAVDELPYRNAGDAAERIERCLCGLRQTDHHLRVVAHTNPSGARRRTAGLLPRFFDRHFDSHNLQEPFYLRHISDTVRFSLRKLLTSQSPMRT